MAIREFPALYTKGKSGEIRRWQVSAVDDLVVITHGVLGGASVVAKRKATPKNVGRSNATTGEQQAILEAQSAHTHKIERKYSLTPEEAEDIVPLPMLAKDFEKAKKIQYPVDVQPKLDGVRAIARWEGDKVVLISRGGKYWTAVPHITRALETILSKGSEFDGELYVHGKPFQWITSRAKKAHTDSHELEYWVYDMPTATGDDSLTWVERERALEDAFADAGVTLRDPIKAVPTSNLDDAVQVKKMHDIFVGQGYEGAIIRLRDGKYEYGHRSGSLLKLKAFDDDEFNIVGYTQGVGSEEGLVLWVCQNNTDTQLFTTRPKGTHEDRRWLYDNAASYLGQKLKVKFFGRTDDGLPRFPIAEGIRVEEDMN